jgi:regulatory protein
MARLLETEAELRNAAFALLGRREYSRAEMEQKLGRRCEDAELLRQVLDQLVADGYQSDERFAHVFTRSRFGSGYGAMRIRQELRQKGLGPELIEQALEDESPDSYQQALECCQRRFGDQPPADPKEYARRMRFLVNRGFSFDDAKRAIKCEGSE